MQTADTKPRASLQRPKRTGRAARTRVRFKPESRDELIERLCNPQISLYETSVLLRVSRTTVRRYADAGKLPCIWTPGGQRRFLWLDIVSYMKSQSI